MITWLCAHWLLTIVLVVLALFVAGGIWIALRMGDAFYDEFFGTGLGK